MKRASRSRSRSWISTQNDKMLKTNGSCLMRAAAVFSLQMRQGCAVLPPPHVEYTLTEPTGDKACQILRKNPIFLLTRRFIHGIIQITYKAYRFVLETILFMRTKRRCKAYDHCVRQPAAAEFPLWSNVSLPGRTGLVRGAQRFALSVKTTLSCYSARELYL